MTLARLFSRLACVVVSTGGLASAVPLAAPMAPFIWSDPVLGKNFPLLALLNRHPAALDALARDEDLAELLARKVRQTEQASQTCDLELTCYTNALTWTDEEITTVRVRLMRLHVRETALQEIVEALRASGLVERHRALSSETLFGQTWEDSARGMNHIIAVYGLGMPPRYPAIDAVSADVNTEAYRRLVTIVVDVLLERRAEWQVFYQPSLAFAGKLLQINARDEAGRHEPLHLQDNAPAFRRLSSIDWQEYPYSVIVVPGASTDRSGVALDAHGTLRLELAVARYRQRKAPLLLVSGGYVHPNQTPYNEAIEMKRSLMRDFAIPEHAILVDPHARHTTTNLRNAARIIFRHGIPVDRLALITTDRYQSAYIEGRVFEERCARELGYHPHQLKGRLSLFDLAWLPQRESLHADPLDPLDPR